MHCTWEGRPREGALSEVAEVNIPDAGSKACWGATVTTGANPGTLTLRGFEAVGNFKSDSKPSLSASVVTPHPVADSSNTL